MKTSADTAQFLELIQHKKVLVIGDVMIDQYLSGSVSRISPEAPVPIMLHQDTSLLPGGAANVALNLAGLGNEVWIASAIGDDQMGRKLVELLNEKQINTDLLLTNDQRMTTCKTRIMAGKQHLLRVDQETTDAIQPELLESLVHSVKTLLKTVPIDFVILQDYNKGILSGPSIKRFLKLLHEQNIPIAVDPKFDHFYEYLGVSLFKPNLAELRAILPFPVEVDQQSLLKATKYVRSKLGCKTIMVTLSDKGIFIDNGSEHHLLPAQKRLIADVCGAGDTVISVASLCLSADLDLSSVAHWSGLCGTLVCQYPGVMPVSREMLLEFESDLASKTS
ncbi:MAG: carbohydrate kinase [Saprospiraceae bacterium]|nr:carbohydrate kinase [Saprospiraceae bacterium]